MGKSPTSEGNISILKIETGLSENDWNLTLGCRRFSLSCTSPVLDSIVLIYWTVDFVKFDNPWEFRNKTCGLPRVNEACRQPSWIFFILHLRVYYDVLCINRSINLFNTEILMEFSHMVSYFFFFFQFQKSMEHLMLIHVTVFP